MRRIHVSALLVVAAGALGACAASGSASPGVPSLGGATTAPTSSATKAALVHATAQCLRQHGIPDYQEPVITAGGQVYSDTRSIQNAPRSAQDAAQHACQSLAAQAGFEPTSEPPAPPALLAAGVRAAVCLRANGLPHYTDPTAQSPYTPGHGFGISGNEIPSGGKLSPAFQQAASACRSLLDDEIRASTFSSLSNG